MVSSAVILEHLSKHYKTREGEVRAVDDLSLDIQAGQTVALLGPNGAGKTTTIDMMLGLTSPSQGRVVIGGDSAKVAVRSGRVGAMLQNGGLVPELTVRETVGFMASVHPRSMPIEQALAVAGLTEHANRRAGKLSGGEAQRVRFAMAIVSRPTLLVLDEPTVAMDVKSREDFWTTMTRLERSGVTALFASHYLDEADLYADRVVVISRGRVLADGTPAQIKALAGGKRIQASAAGVDQATLTDLPGVASATVDGVTFALRCHDSDAALKAVLLRYPDAQGIEVTPVPLEEAFLTITERDTKEALL